MTMANRWRDADIMAARDRSGTMRPPAAATTWLDLQHEVYDSFQQVWHLRDEWNSLAREYGDLFGCFDWCEVWWKHFGSGRRLEIHMLRADGQLVGVLPLFRETLWAAGAGLRVVRLVGCDHTLDAAGLAIRPSHARLFLREVFDRLTERGEWDVLHLGPLRSYMTVMDTLAEAAAEHEHTATVLAGRQDHWLTMFHLPGDYDEYLANLPKHERRDTVRRQRKLEQEHRVEVRPVENPADVADTMDTLVRMHQGLWKTRGYRGQFGDWPGYHQFHQEMAGRLFDEGHLALLRLEVDGQVRGTLYGYRFGPRVHALISGHHQEPPWHAFSLGRLLHCRLVQQAIDWGVRLIDDGRGAFEHKERLGGRLHGERSLTVVRRSWTSRLRFWMALRTAYLVHVAYGRIWYDYIATRLGWHRPLRECYIRSCFLARLYRRIRGRRFGQTPLEVIPTIAPVHVTWEINRWLTLAGNTAHLVADAHAGC